MSKVLGRLRCPYCSEVVEVNDKVFMIFGNWIIHQKCYFKHSLDYEVVDKGTLNDIILRYWFFQ
ncbi:hypothetical protein [Thermaerobacillus caldiproteolyticus]|uniref:hypothetical protein n=1 Tax=Thermaerobacillus caldiproteolyticus TaxID=247480 RepID=UPI0018F2570A|nr:hypothetical protein [Anoxybacillus caldiproteolyticus]